MNLTKIVLIKILIAVVVTTPFAQNKQNPEDFLPEGYIIYEEIRGDLNKDGVEDLVLYIKGTDTSLLETDHLGRELDFNRGGIIVLFNKNGTYELASKNYDCFSPEDEDDSFSVIIEIKKNILYILYSYGKYGYTKYTFRWQNKDFELIGCDFSNNRGATILDKTSINFSTKKELETLYTDDEENTVYKETWTNISIDKLIRLSEIEDVGTMGLSKY